MIPAFEPVVAFAVQGIIVSCVLRLNRWLKSRRDQQLSEKPKLSILGGLLLTVIIALAAALFMRLPEWGWRAWLNVTLVGLLSGIATLTGVWFAAHWPSRIWLTLPIALTCCFAVCIVFSQYDATMLSMSNPFFGIWPPTDTFFRQPSELNRQSLSDSLPWASILVGISFFQFAIMRLASASKSNVGSASNEDALTDQSRQSFAKGITARLVMALLIVLWVSPTIFIYVQLVTPIPIPKQPDDNSGWESLTSAGIEAETSPYIDLLERGVAPTQTELTEAVNALSPVYVLLDLGLRNNVPKKTAARFMPLPSRLWPTFDQKENSDGSVANVTDPLNSIHAGAHLQRGTSYGRFSRHLLPTVSDASLAWPASTLTCCYEAAGCIDRGNVQRLWPRTTLRHRSLHAYARRMVGLSGAT
ncbi:MAG: hypothetical protein AAGG48_28050 [Planctomycetota bacterium]